MAELLTIKPPQTHFDAIIIGAGAAGLFCAGQLGARGKSVLLLEHSEKPAQKILISGGGRCNFTNLNIKPDAFISQNPHFARSALARYTQHDFIELLKTYKIAYYEKTLGQLFCEGDGSSKKIIEMLLDICKKNRVKIKTSFKVEAVEKLDVFKIYSDETNYTSDSLIIATGGKSIPKLGATGFAYKIAEQFGINVIEPKAALVPLMLTGSKYEWLHNLAGIAIDAIAKKGKVKFEESLLFTHRGLSGPSVLQISSYRDTGDYIDFDLAPKIKLGEFIIEARKKSAKQLLSSALTCYPARFAKAICTLYDIDKPLQHLSQKEINQFEENMKNFRLLPSGDEGYAKAEVTHGGIDTMELNQKTMESKKVSGLYFIGEAVDVTGWLGGYNFQWAWSSGFVAAEAI